MYKGLPLCMNTDICARKLGIFEDTNIILRFYDRWGGQEKDIVIFVVISSYLIIVFY